MPGKLPNTKKPMLNVWKDAVVFSLKRKTYGSIFAESPKVWMQEFYLYITTATGLCLNLPGMSLCSLQAPLTPAKVLCLCLYAAWRGSPIDLSRLRPTMPRHQKCLKLHLLRLLLLLHLLRLLLLLHLLRLLLHLLRLLLHLLRLLLHLLRLLLHLLRLLRHLLHWRASATAACGRTTCQRGEACGDKKSGATRASWQKPRKAADKQH